MAEQLRFVLGGQRLIVLNTPKVLVFETNKYEMLLNLHLDFVALSKDESLIAIVSGRGELSLWDILAGTQVDINEKGRAYFAQSQLVHSWSRGGLQKDFVDIFTREIVFVLKAPNVEGEDSPCFDRWSHRFLGSSYLFQTVSYDGNWGETSYVWCMDLETRSWKFSYHYSTNLTPFVSLSASASEAVISAGVEIARFDTNTGQQTSRVQLSEPGRHHAVNPLVSQNIFVATDENIKTIHLMDKIEYSSNNLVKLSEVLAMTVEPHDQHIILLVHEDAKITLQIRSVSTGELLHVAIVDSFD